MSLIRLRGLAASSGAVGPAATWNGTALSGIGGAAPAMPTPAARSTAYPTAAWLQSDQNVILGNTVIGVSADAYGGIASVRIYGDCASTTLTVPGIVNGIVGYYITLNQAAFTAISTTGTARLFADITANDGSMLVNTIGFARFDDSSSTKTQVRNYWEMNVFPRAAYAFDKKIGATWDYPDLASFIAGAIAANATTTRATFMDNGAFYDATTNTATSGNTSNVGLMKLQCNPGVAVTIGRVTAYDPNGSDIPTSWAWRPGWHGIEFGTGISLDFLNWTSLYSNLACSFNGCTFTNSGGANAVMFGWNLAGQPAMRTWSDAHDIVCGWHFNTTVEYSAGGTSANCCMVGSKVRYMNGDPADDTDFCFGNFVTLCDVSPATNFRNALTIQGPANSTVFIDGTTEGGATTLICKVSGTAVSGGTFTLVSNPGAETSTASFSITDMAAKITAIPGGGWTGTVIDATQGSALLMPLANVAATGAGAVAQTRQSDHTEFYHSNSSGTPRWNVYIKNNVIIQSFWTSEPFNFEGVLFDCWASGNVVQMTTNQGSAGFGNGCSNCNFVQNQYDSFFDTFPGDTADAYCHIAQNIICGHDNQGGTSGNYPNYPAWINNLLVTHVTGLPSGPHDGGNVQTDVWSTVTNYEATWANFSAGQAGPAGLALTDTFAPLTTYDGLGQLYANPDAPGAWRIGTANRNFTWPVGNYPWS